MTMKKTVTNDSPRRMPTMGAGAMNDAMSKTQNFKAAKKRLSLTKAEAVSESNETKYECATSIRMKNSYLIKNANASFERSYANIRKKAMDRERTAGSPTGFNETLTKTCGKRPPARDGHTGIVHGNNFFVFGGDRH